MIKIDRDYSEHYRRIGLKVAYYRRLKGYTQEELADAISKSATLIRSIEAPNQNRRSYYSINIIFAIAEELNIPVYKFFTDIELYKD